MNSEEIGCRKAYVNYMYCTRKRAAALNEYHLHIQSISLSPWATAATARGPACVLCERGGCSCGFGRTVQLADGTLVTPYSYVNATVATDRYHRFGTREGKYVDCNTVFTAVMRWLPRPSLPLRCGNRPF